MNGNANYHEHKGPMIAYLLLAVLLSSCASRPSALTRPVPLLDPTRDASRMAALAYMSKHPEEFSKDPEEWERQYEVLVATQTEATVTKFEETHRPLTPEEIASNNDTLAIPPGRYRPLVDPASIRDRARYERDLGECFVLADQHTRPPGEAAIHGGLGGAMVGAGLSALLSWILGGSPSIGAASGAVIGGVSSAGAAAQSSALTYEMIYRNCMIGRGWAVLR